MPVQQISGLTQAWRPGDALTRWNISPLGQRHYPGEPGTMPDRLNYAFRNGWVDTGDLPCRQALRAELPGRAITLPDMDFSEVHLGSHGDFVDFSGFCTTPTLRERFARCAVYAPSAQTISLRVETCGGVHIWLGAKKVCVFEPFERNTKRSCEFTTKVSPGWHYLTVRFEDLHERDTVYGFGLRLLENTGLRGTPNRRRRGCRSSRCAVPTDPCGAAGARQL